MHFEKKVPEMKHNKKMVCNFLHNEKCSRQTTHSHTHVKSRNALHARALKAELSCEIQTQKYILKLKCDCLSKCKQSKGCAGLTHTRTLAYPLHRRTMHRKRNAFLCILQICSYKGSPLFVARGCEFRCALYTAHN